MDDKERYSQGTKKRREVLGDAHVDRSVANQTAFNGEFQEFITRYAWGEVWTRPGLDSHSRSLITVAMLTALGREAVLRLHLRGALNNGVTRDQIKEVLMHSAIYAGVPAANSAFHIAQEVFATIDAGK
jgi:4-carboxymuconolactone decarboxylase